MMTQLRMPVLIMVFTLVACNMATKPIVSSTSPSANPSIAKPNPVPSVQTWTYCTDPYKSCDFVGLRDVRIGSPGNWQVKEFFNGVPSCRSEVFQIPDPNGDGGKTCEVSSFVKTGTLAAPVMAMGPTVDLTKIPLGSKGYSELRVGQASSDPSQQPTKHSDTTSGEFRTHCDFSHMSYDDPIVYPGGFGKSHLHTFFGNTMTHANSTALSISSTGNSTCAGGIANRTAYWVPTLVDTKDGTPIVPEDSIWYYKNGSSYLPAANIKPMPKGLRMIAGNSKSTQSGDNQHSGWSCWNTSGQNSHSIPTTCPVGDYVVMNVGFPQCWNGLDLDSPDHQSHMAYPVSNGQCPSSHRVAIPEIALNLKYKVHDAFEAARWRLSSDMYSDSIPGGFSAHADWFDGWVDDIKNTFVTHCNVAGYDCHAFLLGDGRSLY